MNVSPKPVVTEGSHSQNNTHCTMSGIGWSETDIADYGNGGQKVTASEGTGSGRWCGGKFWINGRSIIDVDSGNVDVCTYIKCHWTENKLTTFYFI
jgi:hypothetical protein